jgi:hypothetical protein
MTPETALEVRFMRRLTVSSIIIIVLSLIMAACSIRPGGEGPKETPAPAGETTNPPKSEAVLTGKIARLDGQSILLAGDGENDLYTIDIPADIYSEGTKVDVSSLKAGQTVEIGFDGLVMESFPMQIGEPEYINITGQSDDLIGFFMSVTDDLWNVDPGLNSEAEIIAFDLTKAANLNGGEKSALVYLAGGKYSPSGQGMMGTFEELCEQGLIDRENLYFETGILFTIEVTDVTEAGFTFDAQKWRSGTGAYFFNDCKAVKTSEGWSYTIGSEAIS